MPNSYEHSYQHDLYNVIDASDAVLAIGTEKVDTNTLKDRSLTGNDGTIHGAMPSSGYFSGRRFEAANGNYLNCGNDSSLNTASATINIVFNAGADILSTSHPINNYLALSDGYGLQITNGNISIYDDIIGTDVPTYSTAISANRIYVISYSLDSADSNRNRLYIDGILIGDDIYSSAALDDFIGTLFIGQRGNSSAFSGQTMYYISAHNIVKSNDSKLYFFNTIARLPLYSHNFTQYPNSDTALTSMLPYTSGQITLGSFVKEDGLKCTSAGTIVFSNNFEFDGSEYITLTIDGVEYSGTTTVTQGTIAATIAQGSNDITIDMGTNDVLEDIRIQFREEV